MHYFGINVPAKCSEFGQIYEAGTSESYMFVHPLQEQLIELLHTVNWSIASDTVTATCSNELKDVSSGCVYSRLKQNSQLTLQFNCDGAPIFKSSKFSIWPLVCTVNELSMALLNANLILHAHIMVWQAEATHRHFIATVCLRNKLPA